MNLCVLLVLPINRLTLMALFAAVAGLYFFIHGLQLLFQRRSRSQIPESSIRDASIGPVAISGMAAGPHTLPAPISGKPCYLYQTIVWQQINPGRNQQWEKVAEETLHLPFFVEDATGRLLVEPLGADLDLRPDFREEYSGGLPQSGNGIPPRLNVFLARHCVALGRPTRVEERSIKSSMPLFVAGTVSLNPGIQLRPFSPRDNGARSRATSPNGAKPAEPASPQEVIQLSGGPAPSSIHQMSQQEKIAAALTRAGVAKPEAWAAAGVPFPPASPSVALEEHAPFDAQSGVTAAPLPTVSSKEGTSLPDSLPPLVVMKSADDTFLISSRSQPELVQSLGWQSVAMAVAGPALAALGIYVLLLEWQLR